MAYFHHLFIHFPVAIGALAAVCAVVLWVRPADAFWRESWRRLTALGALAALAASLSGLLSAEHAIEEGVAAEMVALHRNMALAATGLLVVTALLAWVAHRRGSAALSTAAQIVTVVVGVLVGAGAHFGGEMIHPGMTPWSSEPHHHGAAESDEHEHGMPEPDQDGIDRGGERL